MKPMQKPVGQDSRLNTNNGQARPSAPLADSPTGEKGIDYSSGHVPYRSVAGRAIDKQKLAQRIKGWGSDSDPSNRPGIPREYQPKNDEGAHWSVPDRQSTHKAILYSIERPGVTPVFGTTCPPVGLSGLIRKYAYRFGEARLMHWMPLLVADRINVFEGILSDITKGKLPNLWQEMGLSAGVGEPGELARKRRRRAFLLLGLGSIIAGVTCKALLSSHQRR